MNFMLLLTASKSLYVTVDY